MVEAIVILGNFLVLQREDQHFLGVEPNVSGPGQPILGRFLGADEFVPADVAFFLAVSSSLSGTEAQK
jgi:hypothetical protein